MKAITQISEVHNIILDIAKIFHKICIEHKIPYYMLGGTMLGSVRHNGFIPWDDDMDFGVPRMFFNELIDILKTELPSHLVCLTYSDQYGITNEIVKISDMRTVVEESNKEHIENKMGVFIDIFPLDSTDNNWERWSRNWLVSIVLNTRNARYYPQKNIIGSTMQVVTRLIPQQLQNIILKALLPKHGEYYTNYSGAYGSRETIPKDFFGVPELYHFEDIMLYGVQNSDAYLKHLYGDYMKLPPESKRHTHLINIYWK